MTNQTLFLHTLFVGWGPGHTSAPWPLQDWDQVAATWRYAWRLGRNTARLDRPAERAAPGVAGPSGEAYGLCTTYASDHR